MSEPRIVTEPLGGSPLSLAVQSGTLGSGFVMPAPQDAGDWRSHAMVVRDAAPRHWLPALRGAFAATGAAAARLERVAVAGGVVVTTGQQPGLFGGPVYTWSKAISMLALADAIEDATGLATAPVFWAATDDADFAEASATHVVVRGALERLSMANAPIAGTPMARAPLGDVRSHLTALRQACASNPNEAAYQAVEAAYHGGATVGGAFVALLRTLLEPLGVAVLDASHPEVRRASAHVTRAALERADEVARGLAERRASLQAAGYDPQVADMADLSLVFVADDGIKRRVPISEARDIALHFAPEALSPNVLLRPVLERAILPTVSYVAGPGELAYFPQATAVAGALGLAEPIAVARWSCTIVEPSVDRALARLGIGLDELHDVTALERRFARASLPEGLQQSVDGLRMVLQTGLADIARHDRGRLLTRPTLDGAERSMAFHVDHLERRLLAAAKRRGSDTLRDLRSVGNAIMPAGERQERTLNFIPFLAKYGDDLWRPMRAQARAHARAGVFGSPALTGSGDR